MDDFVDLQARIKAIEERNARVEAEKAWEVSIFRKVTIAVMTYVVAWIALFSIGSSQPYLSALIPTIGFVLSVQSLPMIRRSWITHHLHRK